jgi:hypothetical protein
MMEQKKEFLGMIDEYARKGLNNLTHYTKHYKYILEGKVIFGTEYRNFKDTDEIINGFLIAEDAQIPEEKMEEIDKYYKKPCDEIKKIEKDFFSGVKKLRKIKLIKNPQIKLCVEDNKFRPILQKYRRRIMKVYTLFIKKYCNKKNSEYVGKLKTLLNNEKLNDKELDVFKSLVYQNRPLKNIFNIMVILLNWNFYISCFSCDSRNTYLLENYCGNKKEGIGITFKKEIFDPQKPNDKNDKEVPHYLAKVIYNPSNPLESLELLNLKCAINKENDPQNQSHDLDFVKKIILASLIKKEIFSKEQELRLVQIYQPEFYKSKGLEIDLVKKEDKEYSKLFKFEYSHIEEIVYHCAFENEEGLVELLTTLNIKYEELNDGDFIILKIISDNINF